MNAVERSDLLFLYPWINTHDVTVTQYSKDGFIEQEATHEPTAEPLLVGWPRKGSLELDKISMSYRAGLDPVLKGISMSIHDGERIGVLGR